MSLSFNWLDISPGMITSPKEIGATVRSSSDAKAVVRIRVVLFMGFVDRLCNRSRWSIAIQPQFQHLALVTHQILAVDERSKSRPAGETGSPRDCAATEETQQQPKTQERFHALAFPKLNPGWQRIRAEHRLPAALSGSHLKSHRLGFSAVFSSIDLTSTSWLCAGR